ncbi:MAG: signal peptidase II [Lachnospiraceae bacterium]|nr:signal peptidase II [Lachnospiraceae bacterium]
MRYIMLMVALIFGDGAVKNHIEENRAVNETTAYLEDRLVITNHHNYGGVMNFKDDKPHISLFSGMIALLVSAGLFLRSLADGNAIERTGASMLLAGGISNQWDRLKKGYVVDYFTIRIKGLSKIIFNISDWFIFLGGLFLVIGKIIRNR